MHIRTVLLVLLLCCPLSAARAAGLSLLEVPAGGDGAALTGAVWSPCAAPAETVKLRRIEVPGVRDCPVEGEGLALIVISHGAFGWFGGHHDTAAALADAGYVVAAITHPDDYTRRWRTDRPAAVKRVIDHMLGAWSGRAKLDPERIGFFGFSRGGYTGLVAVGGVPDFRLAGKHCRKVPSDPLCRLSPKTPPAGGTAPSYTHDPRIKAAVIAAPLGIVFSADGLKRVTAPVQLWRLENDELASHHNAHAVRDALPVKPEYHVVPDAGHFAILAPCTEPQARAVPKFCKDAGGFDRVAFHKDFNARIAAFFEVHLAGP
ncbi:MAG: alpha/beta hydrolase family protein [Hyphomicrobiales bacterium]